MIIQGIGDHDQLLLLSCEVFGQAVALHLVENKVDNVLYIYVSIWYITIYVNICQMKIYHYDIHFASPQSPSAG